MLILLLPPFTTARSILPLPLKSAVATEAEGPEPAASSDEMLQETEEVGLVVSKYTAFEIPPPGAGFTTVTEALLKF